MAPVILLPDWTRSGTQSTASKGKNSCTITPAPPLSKQMMAMPPESEAKSERHAKQLFDSFHRLISR